MPETISIEESGAVCGLCEDYSARNATDPAKIAVMACEGACSRGEVARRAANYLAFELARKNTVRICLGGAFTKDTGQRNLVRRSERTIAIEGCALFCSSRMMKAVIPGLKADVIQADTLYGPALPFGMDEVTDEELERCARTVAESILRDHIDNAPVKNTDARAGGCGRS